MSKAGRPNYMGINSQSYAALSLFLQYVVRSDLVEIQFEQDKLEDFVLVFNSGKRLICESKYRKNSLTLGQLKSILDVVIGNAQITSNDELLIITEKASDPVKSLIENFRYFTEIYRDDLKNKPPHFEEKHFQLLPKVKLWEVSQLKNRDGILLLMSRVLSSNGSFWIPRETLVDWVNTLLVEGVYLNSQAGNKLTRTEFYKQLEQKKSDYLENNGVTYEEAQKNDPDKIEKVIEIVTSKTPKKKDVCANAISEIVANPNLHYYLLKKLTTKNDLILQDWDVLWSATAQGAYSFELFKAFENNLNTLKNQAYILNFVDYILDHYSVNYFREDFIKKDIVDICQKIFVKNSSYAKSIFAIIKKLYDYQVSKYLYEEKGRDDSWEREEISNLLKEIYDKTVDSKLKQGIVNYILETFNIVEDDGKFWYFTPPQLFQILQDYINQDPERRILWFSKIASEQYQKFYQRFGKKIVFEGWEHMGGGIGQSGSEFSISDRHFVHILEQGLAAIPKEKKWKFMVSNMITEDSKIISSKRPDFLNRACIGYLIEEYNKGTHKKAFEILSSFIKMRMGIPWKPDIIFQVVRNGNLSPIKKWQLVEVSLENYKQLPVNVFVEQIVTQLADSDQDTGIQAKAIQVITQWASDPNYRKTRSMGTYDIVDSVFKLLNNPKNFSKGVEILRTHLNSDYFIQSTNTYGSWDVAKALALVLQKNIDTGINLLEEIYKYKTLSIGQQLVLCGCFDDIPKENHEVISLVYDKFLGPKFKELKSIELVEKKFPHAPAREQLVNYLEMLVGIGEYTKALNIIKILIKDSDPPRDGSNSPDDPKGEFNKHKQIESGKEDFSITTVRGQCAWALQRYGLLPAREYIHEIIPLVKELSVDPNNYVRFEATVPLIELVKNRDTYIPNTEKKERFIKSEDAKEIENIAFAMLRSHKNQKLPAIMKALAHVFGGMRAVDNEKAKEILNIFIKTNTLEGLAPLVVFFAEFRKKVFRDWPWGTLPEFDDRPFKILLKKQIKEGNDEMRHDLAWQFWRLPDEGKTNKEEYNKNLFKISVRYLKLFSKQKYDHSVWEYIYHFIEDYLSFEFESCFALWGSCVEKEKPYLEEAIKDKNNIPNVYWWPCFYNGRVLLAVYDHLGIDEFLKWMDFFADYPPEVYLANDFGDAVNKLKQLPKGNLLVNKIFDKLIKRSPNYYDDKQDWLNQ